MSAGGGPGGRGQGGQQAPVDRAGFHCRRSPMQSPTLSRAPVNPHPCQDGGGGVAGLPGGPAVPGGRLQRRARGAAPPRHRLPGRLLAGAAAGPGPGHGGRRLLRLHLHHPGRRARALVHLRPAAHALRALLCWHGGGTAGAGGPAPRAPAAHHGRRGRRRRRPQQRPRQRVWQWQQQQQRPQAPAEAAVSQQQRQRRRRRCCLRRALAPRPAARARPGSGGGAGGAGLAGHRRQQARWGNVKGQGPTDFCCRALI